jgi:sterol desaturase/sphingolipid hydroxylase (fatty acid hydroxylase superfamily)
MALNLRALLTWGLYPGALCLALLATAAMIARGVPAEAAISGVTVVAGFALYGLQLLHPAHGRWRAVTARDFGLDLAHSVFTMGGSTALVKAATFTLLYAASARLSAAVGAGLWPDRLPLAAQLALALVVGELGAYWVHRLSHEHSALWRIHALHHSSEQLHMLSAGRNHPFSVFASYLAQMTPLILLGATPEVLALQSVFSGVHGLLQHANVKMRTGWLSWILSTPELHHWHHSRVIAESDHNYGSNLVFWDVVFRSRYLPADRPPPDDVGLPHGTRFPETFWGHLLSPFTLRRWLAPSQQK